MHGQIATNAILEQKGAKTALITTRGFRDVLEIQRVRVPKLYDPLYEKPAPLVPRNLRFEIDERLDAYGNVIREPDRAQLNRVILKLKKEKIEALAICLHSFVNPAHEELVGQIIQKKNFLICLYLCHLKYYRRKENMSALVPPLLTHTLVPP